MWPKPVGWSGTLFFLCDTTFCDLPRRACAPTANLCPGWRVVLRAFFISLSESQSLRVLAERSSLGQRISGCFVAGTQLEDALRVTQSLNSAGLSVSNDNLGENVNTAKEARHSAGLYRQLLDQISARKLNANVSLK